MRAKLSRNDLKNLKKSVDIANDARKKQFFDVNLYGFQTKLGGPVYNFKNMNITPVP